MRDLSTLSEQEQTILNNNHAFFRFYFNVVRADQGLSEDEIFELALKMLEGNFYPDSNIFQTAMEQKDTYEGIFMENRELLEAIGTMDAFDLALTALLTDALLEKHLEDKNDLGPKK